jgi:DNA-binding MltR family transcriptional regulator
MSSADELEVTDEEFQFYKEKLQSNVKEYLELDEQIVALKTAVKERNDSRKKLSEEILDIMKKIDINHMNIKDGKLVSKVTNNFKSITKQSLNDSLQNIFKNDDEALQKAFNTILENREKVEKITLKHVKNKGINLVK